MLGIDCSSFCRLKKFEGVESEEERRLERSKPVEEEEEDVMSKREVGPDQVEEVRVDSSSEEVKGGGMKAPFSSTITPLIPTGPSVLELALLESPDGLKYILGS